MAATDTPGDKARRLLAGPEREVRQGTESDQEALLRVLTGLGYAVLEVADAAWLLTALWKQPDDDSDKGG